MRRFKGRATYEVHKSGWASFEWQERCYISIVMRDKELNNMRAYIRNNPKNWEQDRLFESS